MPILGIIKEYGKWYSIEQTEKERRIFDKSLRNLMKNIPRTCVFLLGFLRLQQCTLVSLLAHYLGVQQKNLAFIMLL